MEPHQLQNKVRPINQPGQLNPVSVKCRSLQKGTGGCGHVYENDLNPSEMGLYPLICHPSMCLHTHTHMDRVNMFLRRCITQSLFSSRFSPHQAHNFKYTTVTIYESCWTFITLSFKVFRLGFLSKLSNLMRMD